jgi:2-keto-3-deoxy-L-fuconate dehydrogenase
MNRERFAGKRVAVTGAGAGIGAVLSRRLVAEGASLLLADIDGDAVRSLAEGLGPGAESVQLDVRDEESVRAGLRGEIDVLVNMAGVGSRTSTPDTELSDWEDVFAVNSRGSFLCCKHVIPGMVKRGGGAIVNISSVVGLVGMPNRAAYCAAKGAVIAFTRALAVDHVGQGIRANVVCPGIVDGPWIQRLVEETGESFADLQSRQPMGRVGTPEEVCDAVAYLASDDATFATGTTLVVDGGLTAGTNAPATTSAR